MEDIAPKLLEAIRKDFINILGDAKVKELNYPAAGDYAEEVGAALAEAFHRNLDPGQLPDGKMLWNIADRVIRPMLEQDHKIVSDAAVMVQEALNKAAGIGLKAQRAPLDQDRVSGILNRLVSAEHFAEIAWILDEPIKTFSRSVVDDTIRENAEFHSRAGLHPRIIRTAEHKCCEWCSRLAGVYEYPYDVPKEVYQRHRCCRCIVDYHPGEGKKVQNVHTKRWRDPEEDDIINKRETVGVIDTLHQMVAHPVRLASKSPEELFYTFKEEGYAPKPLKRGTLQNIPFEDGGGFKVNFDDGGLFQYHPQKGSHHGGAYYKISTGKGGIHRYGLDGKEKKE